MLVVSGLNVSLPRTRVGALVAILALLLIGGCGGKSAPEDRGAENTLSLDVDEVLSDTSYALVTQDSTTLSFPDAFLGTPVVVGTIYTSCPNVCSKITANMKDIRSQIPDSMDVQFVSITFDPHRDTPSRLAQYRSSFGLADTPWVFLTGDTTSIRRLMDRLGVRHTIKGTDQEFPTADVDSSYIYTHSNQITLIDAKGRTRATYGGSQTPAELIIEDLQKIRSY